MNTYHIKTFGCQMNISDSERIAAIFDGFGLIEAGDISKADIVIFNTCGVRQMAEDRVYGQVHNLRKLRPSCKIIITGCLANRKDVQRRLKNKADLFFPIKDLNLFENWIFENLLKIGNWKLEISAQNDISNQENIAYLTKNPKYSNKFQAFVPIMTGCNNFCSYCVVPYARGRETSRPVNEILVEIKTLIRKGYKQIFLLGQNVNSYQGLLKNEKTADFSYLLKKINAIPGKFWIHFLSSHPKDMTENLIDTITKSKKVCEYVHLPIQAGDDEVIKRMNRKYTAKHYLGLVSKFKKAFAKNKPKSIYVFSSDIIVGFPGETRKQFMKSADIMKRAGFDMVFFGQFSRRPGTAAWNMKDNVSKKEKERREKFLNEILKKSALANSKKFIGRTAEILVEKQEKNGEYFGKTRTLKNVKVVSKKKSLVGKIINAKITKANVWSLEAEY